MNRSLLPLLIGLSALGECSTQLLLPALPDAAAALLASPGSLQASLTAFIVALGVSQLAMGPLSDRFGRKPVLLAGLTLYLLATLACWGVTDVGQLVVARLFQGIGACAGVVVARAVARDVWGREAASALALIVFGMMLALMASPFVGGLVSAAFGWRAIFLLLVGLGALALATVAFGFTETGPTPDRGALGLARLAGSYGELLTDRRYGAFALALGCTYGVLFAFVMDAAFVLSTRFGLTHVGIGLAIATVLLGLVTGTLAARSLAPRLGPQRLVERGTAIVLGGASLGLAALLAPALGVAGLLGPQMIVTFGAGLVIPSAVAGAVMPYASRAGQAAGLVGFAQMAIAALFGVLLGACHDGTAIPLLAVQAIAATSAFLLFRLLGHAVVAPLHISS